MHLLVSESNGEGRRYDLPHRASKYLGFLNTHHVLCVFGWQALVVSQPSSQCQLSQRMYQNFVSRAIASELLPLEFPRAERAYVRARICYKIGRLTLPYACPKDVAVVHVHHDPLAIERILVYGSSHSSDGLDARSDTCSHVTSRIIAGNIATLCDMVAWTGKWPETRHLATSWRRDCALQYKRVSPADEDMTR